MNTPAEFDDSICVVVFPTTAALPSTYVSLAAAALVVMTFS